MDSALDRVLKSGAGESMRALAEGVGFRDAMAGAIEAVRLAGVKRDTLQAAALEDPDKRTALAKVLRDYTSSLADAWLVDGGDILVRAIARLEADPEALAGRRVAGLEPPTILATTEASDSAPLFSFSMPLPRLRSLWRTTGP